MVDEDRYSYTESGNPVCSPSDSLDDGVMQTEASRQNEARIHYHSHPPHSYPPCFSPHDRAKQPYDFNTASFRSLPTVTCSIGSVKKSGGMSSVAQRTAINESVPTHHVVTSKSAVHEKHSEFSGPRGAAMGGVGEHNTYDHSGNNDKENLLDRRNRNFVIAKSKSSPETPYNYSLGRFHHTVLHSQHAVFDRGKDGGDTSDNAVVSQSVYGSNQRATHTQQKAYHHEWNIGKEENVRWSEDPSLSSHGTASVCDGIYPANFNSVPDSAFTKLLKEIESRTSQVKSVEAKLLISDVPKILEEVIVRSAKCSRLFEGSFVIPTGSVVETTKIGFPDEMDFMCILPQLENDNYFRLIESESYGCTEKKLQILDWSVEPTLLSKKPTYFTATLLRRNFLDNFKTVLDEKFSGWRYISYCYKKFALTVHLSTPHYPCNISVDCCFGFASPTFITTHLVNIMAKSGGGADRNSPHQLSLYELLPNDGFLLRTSSSEIEISYIKSLSMGSNVLLSYRIAKYIVSTMLPRICQSPCYLCEHSFVPSYYLKTILFYLMEKYEDDWNFDKMADRLIEMFSLLEKQIDRTGKRFKVSRSKFLVEGNPLIISELTSPRPDTLIEPKHLTSLFEDSDLCFDEVETFRSFLKQPPLIEGYGPFVDISSIMKQFNTLLRSLHKKRLPRPGSRYGKENFVQ